MKRRFLPIFLSVAMIVGSVDLPASYVYAEAAVQSDYRTEAVSGSDVSADDAAENISAESVSAGDVSESDAAWDDVSANDVSASDVSEQDVSTNDVSEQDVSVSDVSLGDPAVATAEEHVKATDISAYLTVDANGKITKYDPGSTKVTDISIPSVVNGQTVKAIGDNVFKGRTEIVSVEWPSTLETIGRSAFEGDTALTSSDFSGTKLTYIGQYAFKNCSALGEVKFPNTLTQIDAEAFHGAGMGTAAKNGSLTIPASVDKIGYNAFHGCLYLKEVTFTDAEGTPAAIEFGDYYGSYAFAELPKLTKLTLSNRVVNIPKNFASACPLLSAVTWPSTLKTIGRFAFENDAELLSSNFSETQLTLIDEGAFKGCSSLEEVVFPNTLVEIGGSAFHAAGMGKATKSGSLTIPASVDKIGYNAFNGCLYLESVKFEDYNYAPDETPVAIEFGDYYGSYAFAGMPKLKQIILSNRVTGIPKNFASACPLLSAVTWPSTLKTIGRFAFENDAELLSSNFSETQLTLIDEGAFKGCSSLEEVVFPNTLVEIGGSAFHAAGMGKATKSGSLTIPASVDKIGYNAFNGCLYLESVKFEDYNYAPDETPVAIEFGDYYGSFAFAGMPKLKQITLSNRVTKIPKRFTSGCSALQYITINGDVKTIDDKAFYVDKTGTKKDQLVETVLTTNSTIAKEYDWASDNRKLVDKIAGSKPPVEEEQPTIIEIVNPTSVKLSGVTALTVGAKSKLNVTIEPADNANLDRRLVWESSDASIVTVDTTGTVTALKAGTASVTVTAAADASVKDSISITVTAEDDVEAQDMAERPENVEEGGIWAVLYEENGKVINADKKFTYTGAAIKPVVHVYNGNKRLYEGTDYTLSYVKNSAAVSAGDNAGKAVDAKSWDKKTPAVVINPKGNLKDKVYILFSIEKKSLADTDVTARDLTLKYNNGKALKVKSVVQYNGKALKENKDYKITGVTKGDATVDIKQIGTEAGTYTVAIAGTEVNFTGTTTFDVNVAENAAASAFLSLKKATVTYSEGGAALAKFPNQSYLGTDVPVELDAEKLIVQAKDAEQKDVTLKAGTDYLISYQNNRKPGTAKLILTGIGAYAGSSVTKTFKVDKLTMSDAAVSAGTMSIEGMDAAFTFVKGGVKPQPKVTWKFANGSTETLVLGKDYTLAYAKNALCGSAATLTIKGKGNFAGSVTKGFSIQAQTDGTVIDVQAADVVYKEKKGNWQTKVALLDADGKKLVAGKDYDKNLSYVVVSVPAGSSIRIGQVSGASTVLPVGTVVKVSAKGIDNYDGAVFTGSYRVTPASISGVTFKIADQDYTGAPIYPTKSQIQITKAPKGMSTSDVTYEIVSYGVNTSKGNGTVVVRGTGNFGGYKTIKFKIGPRSIFDWWRK